MNELIINCLNKYINLLKLQNEIHLDFKKKLINKYKISKLRNLLLIINNLDFNIDNINDLKNIEGIKSKYYIILEEIFKTKTLKILKNYDVKIKKLNNIYIIIDELMLLLGINKNLAYKFIIKYKIKSINDLKHKILTIKKLNDEIYHNLDKKTIIGLKYIGKFEGKIPRIEIDHINNFLNKITPKFNSNVFIIICGSYRRECEFCSDIDILMCNIDFIYMFDVFNSKKNILKDYVTFLHNNNFILDDLTSKSNRLHYSGFCIMFEKIRKINIMLTPIESYWVSLLYLTGSVNFNSNMKYYAKKKNLTLTKYYLIDNNSNKNLLVLSSEDIFSFIGVKYIPLNER